MTVLLVLVIVLPVCLLLVGVLLGVALARVLARWSSSRSGQQALSSPVADSTKPGRQASAGQLLAIHVVASSAALSDERQQQPGSTSGTPSPDSAALPPQLSSPASSPPPAAADFGSDSLLPSPSASPSSYPRRPPSLELGRLMRAGTSMISQVMDELDTRSAIMRLMSDGVQLLPSPQAGSGRMLSPPGSTMPAGEVHMDEIDLLDCIGKGGYGAVYKASWRQAPVAVKYIVCSTDNHDSLGRAIREVVLSKKMSHPNVVQCYSWTVLTEPDKHDKSEEPARPVMAVPIPAGTSRRSLDATFMAMQQGSLARQQSLRRIAEQPSQEEGAEPHAGPSASVQRVAFDCAERAAGAVDAASEPAPPVRISSKGSTESESGKSRAQPSSHNSSPVIPALRPAGLPGLPPGGSSSPEAPAQAPATSAPASDMPASPGRPEVAQGEALSDAETPAAGWGGYATGSFEEALLAQFQALASEMYLSRSTSLRLSHQPTNSSSFSDVNNQEFMLGLNSRGETQQSLPGSDWASLRESPGSSVAVTPSAAAAERGDANPFRRSRLSRAASCLAAVTAEEATLGSIADAQVQAAQIADSSAVGTQAAGQQQCQPASQRLQHEPAGEAASLPTEHDSGHDSQPPAGQEQQRHPGPPCCLPSEGRSELDPAEVAEDPGISDAPLPEASLAPLPSSSSSEEHCQPCSARCAGPQAAYAAEGPSAFRSSVSLSGWERSSLYQAAGPGPGSGAEEAGPLCGSSGATGMSRPGSPTRRSLPGGGPVECAPAASPLTSFQLWRSEAPGALSTLPRIPSRLGPRPLATLDMQSEVAGLHSRPDTGRSSLGALPPGSPPGARGLGHFGRGASFDEGRAGARAVSPRGSPGAGRLLPPELQVGSREHSRSAAKKHHHHQRRVDEVIDSELTIDSRTDSFNSEEGFGSPVRNRCGGVKSVFELEGLHLKPHEALMVVVMEYCDLGALRKALRRRAFVPHGKWTFQTTYRALLRTAQEIAKGMQYIHDYDIVHGDLKPGNVLLKTHKVDRRGYIAKVSDFGLSRPISPNDTHVPMASAFGTLAYTAPETFTTSIAKKPSDVYSFGIMLWEMFYCKELYEGLLDGQICVGVIEGTLRPEFDDTCPLPYRRLAERCWHQDPSQRPPFKEIVKELLQIEVDFRNLTHRQNSKASIAGSGPNSTANSRPASPDILVRTRSRAADADFARALQ